MRVDCLIVDDEEDLARATQEYFELFGVRTAYVTSGADCFAFLEKNEAKLLLLDINLTDGTGFSVCKKLRERYDLPILFTSARQSDDDVLLALNIGGDDYIKKPYALSVLLAKVKVTLARAAQYRAAAQSAPETTENKKISEALSLDASTMSAVRSGERIPLKAKEFALLSCLYAHRGSIVKKETLFSEVWGDAFYSDGTLNVHIRHLREKLEQDPNDPKLIQTVWGTGYLLEVPDEV